MSLYTIHTHTSVWKSQIGTFYNVSVKFLHPNLNQFYFKYIKCIECWAWHVWQLTLFWISSWHSVFNIAIRALISFHNSWYSSIISWIAGNSSGLLLSITTRPSSSAFLKRPLYASSSDSRCYENNIILEFTNHTKYGNINMWD